MITNVPPSFYGYLMAWWRHNCFTSQVTNFLRLRVRLLRSAVFCTQYTSVAIL